MGRDHSTLPERCPVARWEFKRRRRGFSGHERSNRRRCRGRPYRGGRRVRPGRSPGGGDGRGGRVEGHRGTGRGPNDDTEVLRIRLRHHAPARRRGRQARGEAEPRGVQGHAERGYRTGVLRQPPRQPQAGRLRLRRLRPAALFLRAQVQLRHRLALVLPAGRPRAHRPQGGHELRHGAHGDPLRALRRAPRPRLRRRAETHRGALLPQLRGAQVLREGRAASRRRACPPVPPPRPLRPPDARATRRSRTSPEAASGGSSTTSTAAPA